ncbi:MAG: penicillin-binding protein 2 [Chloroflexota bacterium]|nr:penicillin-binding protein 2 [Chloroflexota bacterium]
MNLRLASLAGVFALAGLMLVARVAYIQLVNDAQYKAEAKNEHYGQQVVRAPRGAILDRNGYPLATTVDAYDVYINRADWKGDAAAQKGAAVIAPVIGQQPADLIAAVRKQPTGLYLAYSGLAFDKGTALEQTNAPGLRLAQTTVRSYPEGDLASNLLGFVGRDHTGLTGIEHDFDKELGGVPGTIYFERDSIGNRLSLGSERVGQKPQPGGNIRLTIDRYIQRLVENELDAQIAKTGARGGTIIVMDPRTGAILAMASRPTFKLTQLNLSNPDQALFRNRAVTDVYEPGSVFKLITTSAAIDLGLVTPNSTYNDTGTALVNGVAIHNWDFSANGITSVAQILKKSLNTGAVWMSGLIGPDHFYQYAQRFGFGQATGVGLGGEPSGLLHTNHDANWSPVDLATSSYGQGIAATPLQVITAVSAIVNGGKLMRPYVVEQQDTPQGSRWTQPHVVRQAITAETAGQVADMMHQVIDAPEDSLARIAGWQAGGKTGTTTRVALPGEGIVDGTIASFVGFAPLRNPRMVMLIKLDYANDQLGGIVAAPVFHDLAPGILNYLGIRPDNPAQVSAAP